MLSWLVEWGGLLRAWMNSGEKGANTRCYSRQVKSLFAPGETVPPASFRLHDFKVLRLMGSRILFPIVVRALLLGVPIWRVYAGQVTVRRQCFERCGRSANVAAAFNSAVHVHRLSTQCTVAETDVT
jgi:hypothetical protein